MVYKLEIVQSRKKGRYHLRLVAANSEIVMHGEELMNYSDAKKTAERIVDGFIYLEHFPRK